MDGRARSIISTPRYESDVGVYTQVPIKVNRHAGARGAWDLIRVEA